MYKPILATIFLVFSNVSKPFSEKLPIFLTNTHQAFLRFSTNSSGDLKASVTNFILQRDIEGLKSVTFNANDFIELQEDLNELIKTCPNPNIKQELTRIVALYYGLSYLGVALLNALFDANLEQRKASLKIIRFLLSKGADHNTDYYWVALAPNKEGNIVDYVSKKPLSYLASFSRSKKLHKLFPVIPS
ncbi:MAG TPA: hypothetical protein VHA52_10975 [Candidatus Babeliaceae bacterium]|nr:hypothetical protein [Candidatus Babeliaceae bacterium]